jgi:hypothetical protein
MRPLPPSRSDSTRAYAVLAVAGDAGGARGLAPVIRALRALPNVAVEARAYGAATEVWRSERLDARPIDSDDPAGFDRVLLATSFLPERWELRVLRRARERGIPAIVVVDFWSQYRERFTLPGGQVMVPDRIAVVDEAMQRELVLAGFPAERLVITGQPAFDALRAYDSPGQRRAARTALRAHTRLPFSMTRVLYISQPLSLQYSADELGFHEDQVLADTIAALGAVLDGLAGRHASLLVKPHPRDVVADLKRGIPRIHSPRLAIRLLDGSAPGGEVGQSPDVRLLALGSDLVIGMNSTALMEACLLRRPVISYQPGLRLRDPLPSNRLGWTRAVYDSADLRTALQEELFNTRHRRARLARLRRIDLPSGAAANIAALVLGQSESRHQGLTSP